MQAEGRGPNRKRYSSDGVEIFQTLFRVLLREMVAMKIFGPFVVKFRRLGGEEKFGGLIRTLNAPTQQGTTH